MKGFRFLLLLFVQVLLLPTVSVAQTTRARGVVTDADTGEPIPFATVAFLNTTTGITTDFDGVYSLETRAAARELGVVAADYVSQVVSITPGSFQTVNFKLKSTDLHLEKVVVTSDDSYERSIIEKVVANRERNNPAAVPSLECDLYTKTELDVSNVEKTFTNKQLLKNFGFVLNYVDTSSVTGKSYLPIMISETSSHYYQEALPPLTREVIKASRISGVNDDSSVAQFTGNLYASINLYNNYVDLFDVHFASPLSAHGHLYYKYYLVDSLQVEGRKTYTIRFHPKSFSTPVFDGEIQIDAQDYALRSAHIKMMKNLNVNWVRNLSFDCEQTLLDGRYWFKKQEKLFADFSVVMNDSSRTMSFLGHRQVDYMNFKLQAAIPQKIAQSESKVLVEDNGHQQDEAYWRNVRPYELTPHEQRIYQMVDSIKRVPMYRDIYTIVSTLLGGYYDLNKFSIGPYYKIMSFNRLEGLRLQFGGRTTTDWSKRLRLTAYGAYGFKDEKWKGSGGVEYVFKKQPRRKIETAFKHDVVQLGLSEGAFSESNLVTSVMSRGNNERMNLMNRFDLVYNHEWTSGLEARYAVRSQTLFPSPYVPFVLPGGEDATEHVKSLTFSMEYRISWDEIVTYGNFAKYHQYTPYPIVSLRALAGTKLAGGCEYYRFDGNVDFDLKLPPVGTSHIQVEAGKIFGRVPYPLLKIHEGNGTYFYDPTAFSCMNYYEFVSDAWVALRLEHDFKGFFLGKIPLMKRLKWRECVSFRSVFGTLDERNDGSRADTEALLRFPEGMTSVEKPYVETGLGVKNIFRVFRVDAFWRLTHREQTGPDEIQKFTLNIGAEISF